MLHRICMCVIFVQYVPTHNLCTFFFLFFSFMNMYVRYAHMCRRTQFVYNMCITHIHIHKREKKKKPRGREKKRLTGKKKEKEKNKGKRKNLGLGAREKAKAARHGAEAGERIKAILYASCAFFFQKKKHTAFF